MIIATHTTPLPWVVRAEGPRRAPADTGPMQTVPPPEAKRRRRRAEIMARDRIRGRAVGGTR
jgi:hypothetical protein